MPAVTNHPVFRQPANLNAKIWRYMDFTKYVWLLESAALYFSRIDKLGDPFEGSTTVATKEAWANVPAWPANSEQLRKNWDEAQVLMRTHVRKWTFVNCWHLSAYESAAMWRLYSKSDEAIAIQTSYSRFVDAFDENTMVGAVNYIDYDNAVFPMDNMLWPAIHKRLSFEHEKEIRAVKLLADDRAERDGESVAVDLAKLIERVYVSPNCAEWYFGLVERLTRRLGYEFSITKSRLSEQPIL